jgi:hypothetical protein
VPMNCETACDGALAAAAFHGCHCDDRTRQRPVSLPTCRADSLKLCYLILGGPPTRWSPCAPNQTGLELRILASPEEPRVARRPRRGAWSHPLGLVDRYRLFTGPSTAEQPAAQQTRRSWPYRPTSERIAPAVVRAGHYPQASPPEPSAWVEFRSSAIVRRRDS